MTSTVTGMTCMLQAFAIVGATWPIYLNEGNNLWELTPVWARDSGTQMDLGSNGTTN